MTPLAALYGNGVFIVFGYVLGVLQGEDEGAVHTAATTVVAVALGIVWPLLLLLICVGWLARRFGR